MSRPQRPDAWFVRIRRRGSYNVMPCTAQGWLVTAAYVLFALALTPVLVPATSVRVAIWIVLFVAATLLFVVVAWRTSSPEADDGKKG